MLSAADVRQLVPMRDAIGTAREAFTAVSRGLIVQPDRLSVADGSTLIMFATAAQSDAIVKVISVRPGNQRFGMSSLQVIVLALDEETGQTRAVIEGAALTALRTGAASGLATDLLAASDASVLGMIGAGSQAADQIRAVCSVRPITELRIASRYRSSAERLAAALAPSLDRVACRAVASPAEAVAGADVVCTATRSLVPLFQTADLNETVHINAIGAYSATMCELPPDLLSRASVLAVDQLEAALHEAGDVIQALDAGLLDAGRLVEIGRLLDSEPPPARGNGISVFKSVGVGAQDWALVKRILEGAGQAKGLQSLELA